MRALIIVLDGAGCGAAPDAKAFGDEGANTLGHIFEAMPALELPALWSLGLWKAVTAEIFSARAQGTRARWGRMQPRSPGKDTMAGHWEIAGAIVNEPFAIYPHIPVELLETLGRTCNATFLGNYAQGGVAILEELGAEHLRTGHPILYTSVDSAVKIAAHESVLSRRRLYEICRLARRCADPWRIGRVIARPFTGEAGAFRHTAGRQDFTMVPPRTILNAVAERGLPVHGIGRVSSIFAGSGVTRSTPAVSNAEALAAIENFWASDTDGLVLADLSDFDSPHGHARDVPGFARALEAFDAWLASFLPHVDEEDLLIITADHGNDPTFRGSEHTREEVPLLALHGGRRGPLGTRKTFADVAATLAAYFRLRGGWPTGRSFL